jgi:hypothetical protein
VSAGVRHDEIGDLDLHSLIILVKVGDQICGFGYYKVRREIRTVRHTQKLRRMMMVARSR